MNKALTKSDAKQMEFMRREQDIVAAALSLFEGPHWEQVTVEQIAKQADIGKGTIYKHFSCKEEIYARIAIDFNNRIMDRFNQIAQSEQDVTLVLKALIDTAFSLFISNPAEAHVIFYCKRNDYRSRLSLDLRESFQDADCEFQEFMVRVLERGIAEGTIPNKPIENMMIGLEATFDGAMTMLWNGDVLIDRVEGREAYVQIISDFMLAGVQSA